MNKEICEAFNRVVNQAYSNSESISMGEGIAYCEDCGLRVRVINNSLGVPSETSTNGKIEENCILYTDSKENMPGPNKEICPQLLWKDESLRSGLKDTRNQTKRGKCNFCPITIEAKSNEQGNVSSKITSGNPDTDCNSADRVQDPR